MKTISKGVKVAVAAMAAASAILAMAGTAAATTTATSKTAVVHSKGARVNPGPCDLSYLCVWVNANYGGDRGQFQDKNQFWGDFPDSECVWPAAAHDADGTWNDCASSGWDNGDSATIPEAVVWQNADFGGGAYCIPQGTGSAIPDFAAVQYRDDGVPTGVTLNDSISSNSWVNSAACREIDTGE